MKQQPQPKRLSKSNKIGDKVYYIDQYTKKRVTGEVIDKARDEIFIRWEQDLNPTTHQIGSNRIMILP